MNTSIFKSHFENASVIKEGVDSSVFLLEDKICKVFNIPKLMELEYDAIKYIYRFNKNTYLGEASINETYGMIIFPLLTQITEITDKLIDDIRSEVTLLNDNGVMHLDVSPDNVVYDRRMNKYILIDYGLSASKEQALSDVKEHGNDAFYKQYYRNPKGFGLDSDMYALSLFKDDYSKWILKR